MNRQFYDGYGSGPNRSARCDMGEVIIPKCAEVPEPCEKEHHFSHEKEECGDNRQMCACKSPTGLESLFPNFQLDDIILLGIAILLLHDGTEDTLLLIVIGFLFLVGLNKD